MIDFIKTDILTTAEYLYNNPSLTFGLNINDKTGEVIKDRYGYITRVANFGQLQIKITKKIETEYTKIELSGSIHKHNKQGTNFEDFTFVDVVNTINQVCDLLKLPPNKFVIKHIEYGVNIKPTHSATNILNSIVAYKGKRYEIREYKGTGYMKRFCLSQYDVKIYDKSKQYSLASNLLRFELKVFKMQYFEKRCINITTFSNLLNPAIYTALFNTLVNCLDSIYMFDYRIQLNAINNTRERLTLTECINTNFWQNYRDTHSAKGYFKKANRFKDLVRKYAPDDLQLYLKTQIQNKWFELLNSTPILPHVQNATVPQNYPLIVGNINPIVKKYCITCGKDISHQKSNSLFCSEKLNGPEGKKCRNRLSNLKRDEKRKYSGPTLFDVDLYLRTDYLHLKQIINQRN